jgi:DNA-binding transcriptional ArsR family regulator
MTTEALSRVFAALADPTRRDMVARLAEGDATANQLAEPYQMTLQAVYKHLRVLEEAGLMDNWLERHRRRAEQRYRRLDALLAEMSGDEA